MSVGDRGQNVEEQTKTCSDIELIDVAIVIDPLAFDVLEDQIRLSGRRDAGVDQACDVRMGKTSKDAAFALKTFLPRAPDQCSVQQLDGDFALEAPVAAPCEPHGAHAALAQRRFQRVRADRLTDQRRLLRKGREWTVRQKAFALERVLLFQKRFELRGERFVFAA